MKRYERYKSSNVEWIGEIPEHWEAKKIRYVLRDSIVDGPHETPEYTNIGIPFISVDSLDDAKYVNLENVTRYISEVQFDEYNKKTQLKINDILFSKSATIGKVAIVDERKFMTWSPLAIIKCDEIKSFYLYIYYLLQMPRFIEYIKCNSTFNTQFNIGMKTLEKSMIPVPPIDEQKLIANYLDKKTAEIGELIADKENLISLLEQEKELTISNAVTKGLNPNIPMKDSKVKWIGEIPEYWDTLPIKFCTQIPVTDGPHETPEFYPQGIPFISAEAIKDDKINFEKIRGYISLEDHIKYSKKYRPLRNDIYMIKSGATTGNIAMVETDEEFNIWSPLAVIRVNEDIVLPKYAFYYMKSMNFFESVKLGWSYGTQQNIGMGVIENLLFCIPNNIDDQEQIVEYLDKKIAETNETVQIIKDEIELLKEYKETLIYEVITGKIDVRAEL